MSSMSVIPGGPGGPHLTIAASSAETTKPICPTNELAKQKTFNAVEAFLIKGADSRFGTFTPLDPRPNPKENLAHKDNGWRLFKAENQTTTKDYRTKEIIMCNKTIMLKSIIKTINSLAEVQEICQLHMPENVEGYVGEFKSDIVTDGAFDNVTLIEKAGEKTPHQASLLVRLNAFVKDYLNAYAELTHLPKEDAPVKTEEC